MWNSMEQIKRERAKAIEARAAAEQQRRLAEEAKVKARAKKTPEESGENREALKQAAPLLLERIEKLMENPSFAQDAECQALFKEVETLLTDLAAGR
jgi:hypothetical protein